MIQVKTAKQPPEPLMYTARVGILSRGDVTSRVCVRVHFPIRRTRCGKFDAVPCASEPHIIGILHARRSQHWFISSNGRFGRRRQTHDFRILLYKNAGQGQASCKVWLTSVEHRRCSNEAKTRYSLKYDGVPQTRQSISAVSGPKFTIL